MDNNELFSKIIAIEERVNKLENSPNKKIDTENDTKNDTESNTESDTDDAAESDLEELEETKNSIDDNEINIYIVNAVTNTCYGVIIGTLFTTFVNLLILYLRKIL